MFMHARFHTAFAALPENLSSALEPFLRHDDFPAMFSAADVAEIKQATGLNDDALAFALLPLAAACSVTPISHFHVGAIARGISGNLYFGPIWNSPVRRCSKRFTPSNPQSPTPGCVAKPVWLLSP